MRKSGIWQRGDCQSGWKAKLIVFETLFEFARLESTTSGEDDADCFEENFDIVPEATILQVD